MKISKWSFAAYVLSALLILLSVKVFINNDALVKIANFTPFNITVILLVTYMIYVTSGIQMALITDEMGIKLSTKDIFLLPIVLNLWSFLIPFQGSLIFSTLYLNSKYKSGLKAGFSISLFVYLLTIFLTGIFGILFLITFGYKDIMAYAGTLSLLGLPVFLVFLLKFKNYFHSNRGGFFSKVSTKFFTIVETLISLFNSPVLLLKISLIKIFRTFLIGCWYYTIANAMDVNLSFLSLILLGLIVDISIIVKVTPDNLGVSQFLSAGVFTLLNLNPNDAVLVTLVASAASIILVFTLGILANYSFLKALNISSIGQVIKSYRKT